MNKAHVNGKLQDVLITSSFKNSEFDKLESELPYSVLEYLFVNNYNHFCALLKHIRIYAKFMPKWIFW